MKYIFLKHIKVYISKSPRGFIFTWWGCCGLCQRHKPTELAHSFFFFSLSFLFVCLFLSYVPFSCTSFHKFSRQLDLRFLSLFFRSYFCTYWSFQLFISVCKIPSALI